MEILIALTISLVAGLSTVVGALFIFYKPANTNNFIGSCLAFSGFNECETPFFASFIIRQKIIITNKIQKLSGRVII